jgi:hypothetical protein
MNSRSSLTNGLVIYPLTGYAAAVSMPFFLLLLIIATQGIFLSWRDSDGRSDISATRALMPFFEGGLLAEALVLQKTGR